MSQDAQVIVFASQKGGSGKTTLSGHIAVQAQLSGSGPVALIDTDPQGSLSKWWNAREAETPVFARASVDTLHRDIQLLRDSGIKLIVIDTPPAVTSAITDVIPYADLVVVPTRPSPHDLRAVGVTVDLVEAQQKPLVFVINCATARARITSETAVSLSQHGTVAPTNIHNRIDFAASMIDGRTVGEVNGNSRSAKEVATLWNYLEERLRRERRDENAVAAAGAKFEVELLTPVRSAAVPEEEPAEISPSLEGWPSESAGTLVAERATAVPPALERRALPQSGSVPDDHQNLWAGIDRRKLDLGPPPGFEDRRRQPTFGRRNTKS